MSEVTHTPGPWTVERSPGRGVLCVMAADTWICGELQADNSTAIPDEECEANAFLIAAAPDMAMALEPFADIDGEGDEDFPDDTPVIVKFGRTTHYALKLGDFRRARAAIAKADDGS